MYNYCVGIFVSEHYPSKKVDKDNAMLVESLCTRSSSDISLALNFMAQMKGAQHQPVGWGFVCPSDVESWPLDQYAQSQKSYILDIAVSINLLVFISEWINIYCRRYGRGGILSFIKLVVRSLIDSVLKKVKRFRYRNFPPKNFD